MNNKILTLLLALSASLLVTNGVAADVALSAEQVKALFSGKTFDGHNEIKGKDFQVYSAADGIMIHKNRKRTKEASWEVGEDGQHCGILKRKICGKIVPVGNGVYHKMKDGEHTHTLKNFVEGNQL